MPMFRFDFGFFSSILLIFFVHGLVYSFLLFRKGIRLDTRSDKYLALFLLLCVLNISAWMVGFAGWYNNQPYRDILFYFPTRHLLWMGPLIFFYIQSLLNPGFRFGRREWLQLIPGFLYILFSVVMFVTDQLILKDYWFLADQTDPDFKAVYEIPGFLSMCIYCFLSIRYFKLYQKLMAHVVSYADRLLFRWVQHFLRAFATMLILQFAFFFISIPFPDLNSYIGSWWYFLFFSIIFYYIAISGYSNNIETNIPFRLNLLNQHQQTLLLSPVDVDSDNWDDVDLEDAEVISIDDAPTAPSEDLAALEDWKSKLLLLMTNDKLYEDPELTLSQVAKQLGSNASVISKVVNQGFQLNFNDFINQFRIAAVQREIKAGVHQTQTLLGIAFGCGFNSKATFNRAFKKQTGVSPKEWMAKNT